ncbi:HEXXH motif domain-containing protein [Nonomuraea sp. NPDC047897]|uniref:HEXXH motif domain-containing protein n=1 Tax=Nonomuraea sp. NPDC047897 TaxID=3364346 RepID=UPI00371771D6
MNRLVIPHHMFEALAGGRGGAAAGSFLAATARDRHLVLLRAVADAAGSGAIRDAFDALARMHDAAPERVEPLLRYPAVGAWALAALRDLRAGGPPDHGPAARMGALAAGAAIRAGLRFEVSLPAEDGGVMLPSLGRASTGPGDCLIRVVPPAASFVTPAPRADVTPASRADITPASRVEFAGAGWQGLRTIVAEHPHGDLRITLDDLDPHRFPAVGRPAPRLSEAEVARWRELFQEAWRILRDHHPATAAEVSSMISVVVPLSGAAWAASGTSRTTFGCVALARPRDATALAATLAHEVQHAKLTTLLYLVDLIAVDPGTRYYAPWRHDPRPITGLLHGTYAHLGVAEFWRRQRHVDGGDGAHAEFARWREAAADTARVIHESSALTSTGRRFVDGMTRALLALNDEAVPSRAVELARRAADRHRRDYGAATGPAT